MHRVTLVLRWGQRTWWITVPSKLGRCQLHMTYIGAVINKVTVSQIRSSWKKQLQEIVGKPDCLMKTVSGGPIHEVFSEEIDIFQMEIQWRRHRGG